MHKVWLAVLIALSIAIDCRAAQAGQPALIFHAASAGQEAMDNGEGGGNPFASALVEVLGRAQSDVAELPEALQRLTREKSKGFQAADVARLPPSLHWTIAPMPAGERRIALVLVVADYAAAAGAPSLPGAARDAGRIAAALRAAGFETEVALDLDLAGMRRRLADFAVRSASHDAAAVYTTGHGVEHNGKVFLIPGDYPVPEGNASLAGKALGLVEIARAPRASRVNLVFYGGCRNNPFPD